MRKKVLITGGAGYVGTVLTERLLPNYDVVVYDILFYGSKLPTHPGLTLIEEDIRNTAAFERAVEGADAVIHLACISNDPSFHLDEALSQTINYDCFEPLVLAAKKQGVRRFINASSSSVYGVSAAKNVTEEHPLLPLTPYSRYKGLCEEILFKHQTSNFVCVNIRPATVCGYSPRMRFDLSVNILTNHAVHKGAITVFGGEQKRPNLHIDDMCSLYEALLELPDAEIAGETFNFGHQNYTIREIAEMVRKVVLEEYPEKKEIPILTTETNDKRSYHICSDKILKKLGIGPKKSIEDAVRDICRAFKQGLLPNSLEDDSYFNVQCLMQQKVR